MSNNQATTFKTSLTNAAFISSHGQAYRLFQDTDDPALGNDFNLSGFDLNESCDQNELPTIETENNFCNENYKQIDDLSDQSLNNNELKFDASMANNKIINTTENLAEFDEYMDSERRFNVVKSDCESMVAELMALEVPKSAINIPEPPSSSDNIPFDEKIKRIRGVTGICGKYQPTIQETILGNIGTNSDNVSKVRFIVAKKPTVKLSNANCSTIQQTHQKNKHTTNHTESETKLSFCPTHDNTTAEIDKIIRGNVIPILDAVPDFFNSTPTKISFALNQKNDHTDQNNDCDSFKIVNSPNDEAEYQNIVTIINDNCPDEDELVSEDEIVSESDEVLQDSVFDVGCDDVEIASDVVLFRRELCGYELPEEITTLMNKASDQVSDLGNRFIDLIEAGKRIISVNGCFAGDGCSLISVFAAVELVSRGKRVLLIDANCRNPALAEFLGVDDISEREIVTLQNNFDFVTAFDKKITTDTKEIFCNNKNYSERDNNHDQIKIDNELCRFIGELSDEYDFILFDSGCIADVPFSSCINNWQTMRIDGIFLVVCKRKFQSVNFNNIKERLTEQQIELTGIMVSGD